MATTKGRLFAAFDGTGWGFITGRGRWFVPPEFASIEFPQDGIFPAKVEPTSPWTLHSIADHQSIVAELAPTVSRIGPAGSGLRAFQSVNGRWGFFDKAGSQKIEPRFDTSSSLPGSDVFRFENGQACVGFEMASFKVGRSNVWGLLDKLGNTLVEPSIAFIAYGEGSFIVEPTEDSEQEPPFGFDVRALGVSAGPECRVLFRDADVLRPFRFGYAPFGADPANHKARCEDTYFPQPAEFVDIRWGLVDRYGSIKISAVHEGVRPYCEQFAPFRKNGLWGFLNMNGDAVIAPTFREVEFFAEGLSACQNRDSRWGIIDYKGKWIVEPTFENLSSEFAAYS